MKVSVKINAGKSTSHLRQKHQTSKITLKIPDLMLTHQKWNTFYWPGFPQMTSTNSLAQSLNFPRLHKTSLDCKRGSLLREIVRLERMTKKKAVHLQMGPQILEWVPLMVGLPPMQRTCVWLNEWSDTNFTPFPKKPLCSQQTNCPILYRAGTVATSQKNP